MTILNKALAAVFVLFLLVLVVIGSQTLATATRNDCRTTQLREFSKGLTKYLTIRPELRQTSTGRQVAVQVSHSFDGAC